MDRLGASDTEDADGPNVSIWQAGGRAAELIKQAIASVVILGTFIVLAYLVLREVVPPDGLILYAGVILGYLLHGIKDLI